MVIDARGGIADLSKRDGPQRKEHRPRDDVRPGREAADRGLGHLRDDDPPGAGRMKAVDAPDIATVKD